MSRRFTAELVNGPYDDPGVLVDFAFERRAVLFDLGDLAALPPRKLLRVTDAFVSHMHLDHFIGFDRLLRLRIGRASTLRLFGPKGFVDAVRAKLAAYSWNLIAGYEAETVLVVHELAGMGRMVQTRLSSREAFQEVRRDELETPGRTLLDEAGLTVRFAVLDHGIPCLAFALEDSERVNILKGRLEGMGLAVGPWLNDLKAALRSGAPKDTPVHVKWLQGENAPAHTLPLGLLADEVTRTTRGEKIAYVVDARHTPENARRIVDIARGADTLFIESRFLHEDAVLADARNHLTARQAGALAREAGVQRVEPFQFSPRYEGREDEVRGEVDAAFGAGAGIPHGRS